MDLLDDYKLKLNKAIQHLVLSKYLRAYVLLKEPGFRGPMRDFLNHAEKLGIIQNVELWVEIRELRNVTAHEYSDQAFADHMMAQLRLAPHLMELKNLHAPH